MGKKTRRKTRNNAPKEATDKPASSVPTILQRIRHADASIRQAALTGILHARLLHRNDGVSAKLLLAVREQYMGSDLNCATAAADCLADYLEFAEQVDEQLTAGWVALVIDRLQLTVQDAPLNLVSESLQMLALLIEENPIAMNRLINNKDLRESCMARLVRHMEWGLAQSKDGDEIKQQYSNIFVLATRCIESLFQDNATLLHELGDSLDLVEIFKKFYSLSQTPGSSMVGQLHLVGAWLSTWALCRSLDGTDEKLNSLVPFLETFLGEMSNILGNCLQQALSENDQTKLRLQQLAQAHQEWQAELADKELDNDIIKQVNARREPARQIFRRQRQVKEQQQRMDTDDAEPDQEDGAPVVERIDKESMWFQLFHEFESQETKPTCLALEILANFLLPVEEDGDAVMNEATRSHPLTQSVVEKYMLLKHTSDLLSRMVRLKSSSDVDLTPLPIRACFDAMASKAGTCVTHALQHFPTFEASLSLWKDLYRCLLSFPVSGLSHAMVVCLQTAGGDDECARLVLEWLANSRTDCAQAGYDTSDLNLTTRDFISMLGLLCNNEEYLVKGASLLVQTSLPDDDLVIRGERLNVLIDLFSDDSRHEVFERVDLLKYFQQELPLLQRQVSLYRGDEVELFQEVAMNTSHFIQYKKGVR